MILIYKTDNHHTQSSRLLIGVCTTLSIAIKVIKEAAKVDGEKISKDDLYNLQHIAQTQGYEGEGEFLIETVSKNNLINYN